MAESGSSGSSGSVIADKYASGAWTHARGQRIPERYPTNKEVAAALAQQVSASVATYHHYLHAIWFTIFVAAYMAALYFQASSFQAGQVVAALKDALLPDGRATTARFSSEDQVLAFLGNKVLTPSWTDPVCGDGACEGPWEFAAWGPFGCAADCGSNPNTTKVVVTLSADFSGHPALGAATLRDQVSWNLCLNDSMRQERGLPPLCWFESDQVFSEVMETQIKAVSLVDGAWYVRLDGDLAGRVTGAVYDATAADGSLTAIPVTPRWEACKIKRQRVGTTTVSMRRLLSEFTLARARAGPAGEELLQQALSMAAAEAAKRPPTATQQSRPHVTGEL